MASIIRSFVDKIAVRHQRGEAEKVVTDMTTAGISGAVLGTIQAKRKGGLDYGKVPMDIAGAAAVAGLTTLTPLLTSKHRDTNEKVRQVAATAFGIGVYRKVNAFVAAKQTKVHGEFEDGSDHGSDDELLRIAARL
jgi:hypothetical protein